MSPIALKNVSFDHFIHHPYTARRRAPPPPALFFPVQRRILRSNRVLPTPEKIRFVNGFYTVHSVVFVTNFVLPAACGMTLRVVGKMEMDHETAEICRNKVDYDGSVVYRNSPDRLLDGKECVFHTTWLNGASTAASPVL